MSTATPTIQVQSRFNLLPKLSEGVYADLRTSIDRHGCRDPLVVWKGHDVLLDGHNRLRICTELGVPYDVVEVECRTERDAERWIYLNALCRRNLTPAESSYVRGRLHEMAKADKEKNLTPGPSEPGSSKGQSNPSKTTAEQVAEETGVSERTVKRDAAWVRALDAIAETAGQDAADAIRNREIRLTRADTGLLASMRPTSLEAVQEFAAERSAKREARTTAAADDLRPFLQRTVEGFTTYHGADGVEYVTAATLVCGHEYEYTRLVPAPGTAKTHPCVKCGSGRRTPADRRKAQRALRLAAEQAVDKAFADPAQKTELVKYIINTELVLPLLSKSMDKRVRRLVDAIDRHGRLAGLRDREAA